jgi:arginine:agmatine antiporter
MTDMTSPQTRTLGWGLAALLVAGNMIGSGVFLLPATLAPIGSSSLVGWIVASIGALILAGVFAALGRLRPSADGLTDWSGEALGRFFGYTASLAYWAAGWIGNCAIAVAATGYLAHFFPVLEGRWAGIACNIGLIWLMSLAYMAGARTVARLGGVTLVIGLVPLVIAIVGGAMAFDPEIFSASWSPDGASLLESVPASMALIFWAFLGVESAGVFTERLRDPARDVGRATFGGVALAAVVYIAASVAVFGVIPAGELAVSTSPFADLAGRAIGAAAAGFVAVCAVAKALGTLGGWIMLTGETARAAARRGFLPRAFGASAITPPSNPLIHAGLMSLIAVLSAQPSLAGQFGLLIALTTILILVVYVLCCLALFRFTRSNADRLLAAGGLGFSAWAVAAAGTGLLWVTLGFFVLTSLGWVVVRRGGSVPVSRAR